MYVKHLTLLSSYLIKNWTDTYLKGTINHRNSKVDQILRSQKHKKIVILFQKAFQSRIVHGLAYEKKLNQTKPCIQNL